MGIHWAGPNLPPINLWSAPENPSLSKAKAETIQQSLDRLGFDSQWVQNPRGSSRGLIIHDRRANSTRGQLLSATQALDLIDRKDGQSHG
jgi:hypothetical protein